MRAGPRYEIDLGTSARYPAGLEGPSSGGRTHRIHYRLPAGYEPTRSKKEMRDYCIPEWESARSMSWPALASLVVAGIEERAHLGLYFDGADGFYKRAVMYALATLHSFAELAEQPQVLAKPCDLSSSAIRADLEGGGYCCHC